MTAGLDQSISRWIDCTACSSSLTDRDIVTLPGEIKPSALHEKVLPVQEQVLAVHAMVQGTSAGSADALLETLGAAAEQLTSIEREANRTSDNTALVVLNTCRDLISGARTIILARRCWEISGRLIASHL